MTQRKPVRILYVEDDPDAARLFQKSLERAGYVVDCASDGEEGLAMYEAGPYELVVVDYYMPKLTGLDVIRQLLRRGPLPPTIMLTGTGREEIAVEAIKLGADDYIVKDVEGSYLDLFPSVIEEVLQRRSLAVEERRKEERLHRLNTAFSSLSPDFHSNIQRLVEACGDILEADGAMYGRVVDGRIYPTEGWRTLGGYNPAIARPGHICYDVVKRGDKDGVFIVANLPATPYAETDPNVDAHGLSTYVGQAVRCFNYLFGALVLAYRVDVAFTESDEQMMGVLAAVIGIEEERMLAEVALRSPDVPCPPEPPSS